MSLRLFYTWCLVCVIRVAFGIENGETLFKNKCADCHNNSNSSAPFRFKSINDIVSRKSMIKYVIENNIMPVWKPDTSYVKFKNCRALSINEKSQLLSWIGTIKKTDVFTSPVVKSESEASGQGTLNFEYPFTITLPPSIHDTDISFEYAFSTDEISEVSQIIFYCSNIKLVHHANLFIVDSFKYKEHRKDTAGNYIAFGYAPGNKQEPFESGYGYILPKNGVINGDLHLSPRSKEVQLKFGVKLIKSVTKLRYNFFMFVPDHIVRETPILIPPDSIVHFARSYVTDNDLFVKYTHPHMHVFGKSFLSYAVTPQNDTINIVKVDKWNFYQQEFYEYVKPLFIPAKSVIYNEAWYDNTSNNPYNPFSPPTLVTGGISTNQEMLTNILICYRAYNSK